MIYAIRRKTKEHFVSGITENHPIFASRNGAHALDCEDYYYVKADADGWIEWSGGECPLPGDSRCLVRFRDGGQGGERTSPRMWHWGNDEGSKIIIAYRPILEPQAEQVKGWRGPEDGLPPVGTPLEGEHAAYGWIKGRFMFHDEEERVVVLKTEHGYLGFGVYRNIRTDRERWIEAATLSMGAKRPKNASHLGLIYDAGLAKLQE